MLVPKPNEEMKLTNIVSVLKSSNSNIKVKSDTYSTFSDKLKVKNEDQAFLQDVAKSSKQVISLIQSDIQEGSSQLTENALQVLGLFLQNHTIVNLLRIKDSNEILEGLCRCALDTEDKSICTRVLWCLANQVLQPDIVSTQINPILDALEHSFSKPLSHSVLVEHEAVNLVVRLLQQVPKKMNEKAILWSHHVYSLLGHGAIRIREKALQALSIALPALLVNPNGLVASMVADVKTKMASELKKLFQSRNEVYVLRVWSLLVQLLGKELHCVFINQLLPIVELGFKSPNPNIKYEAFSAWKYLIENFASNPAIIGDQKRIKLLMQVFKINNAKTENVALKKLEVWWYFVRMLGTKLLGNFDMVCTPLLRFCVGGKWTEGARNMPTLSSVGSSISIPSQGAMWPSFPSLQLKGLWVIAHFLRLPPAHADYNTLKFDLEPLNSDIVMTPALFLKQCNVIAYSIVELVCSVKASDDLLVYIWSLFAEHLKLALEAGLKIDCRDALSSFLCDFSTLILSRPAPYSVKHKLFLAVSKLPKKILSSTAYNISSGEKIHGTPALFLTELLLTPSLLEEGIFEDNYLTLFINMIELGLTNPSGVLEYCQAVVQILDRHATYVEQKYQLWRLWSCLVNPLLDYISKHNEINQGDALEHNFTCLYHALFFPVKWLFGTQLFLTINKTLMKTWSNIYRTFANLAALVVNAAPNVTCEHLSHLIFTYVTTTGIQKLKTDPVFIEHLSLVCETLVGVVDFSSHGNNTSFVLGSPGKWSGKRKQNPLKNLNTFIDLVVVVIHGLYEQVNNLDSETNADKQNTYFTSLQSAGKHLLAIMTTLFTEITSPNSVPLLLEKSSLAVSNLFILAKAHYKVYHSSSLPKHDKLWQDITNCVQNNYKGIYDTDLLNILSPLLAVNFTHPRRFIKNQTVQLWKATFSQAPSLTYTDALRYALTKVKEKMVIGLPGWISSEIHVIEETPTSQYSLVNSQVSEDTVPTQVSPSKMHGSLLKNLPSPKKPSIISKPKPAATVMKNLPIGEMKDQDFVVIEPPQNKRRILTQHQKEVLKERKFSFPAMYNSLDQSQDSMYSNHMVSSQAISFSSDETSSQYNLITTNKSNQENCSKSNTRVTFSKDIRLHETPNTVTIDKITECTEKPQCAGGKLEHYTKIQPASSSARSKLTRNKEPVSIKSGKVSKNISEDKTSLQNWLCTKQSSKVTSTPLLMEPHMTSLVAQDSLTNDSLSAEPNPLLDRPVQSNLFVEETQSPLKLIPTHQHSGESVLETPVKMLTREVNTNVNIRRLSFDLREDADSNGANSSSNDLELKAIKKLEFSAKEQVELTPNKNNSQMVSSEKTFLGKNACKTEFISHDDAGTDDCLFDSDCNVMSSQNTVTKSYKRKLDSEEKIEIKKLNLEENNPVNIEDSPNDNQGIVCGKDKVIVQPSGTVTPSNQLNKSDVSPTSKPITGSRKRKPLKVTKIVQNADRRISPVRTRSCVKHLRARKKGAHSSEGTPNKSACKKKTETKKNRAIKALNVSESVKHTPHNQSTSVNKLTSVRKNIKNVKIPKTQKNIDCEISAGMANSDFISSFSSGESESFTFDQEMTNVDSNIVEQKKGEVALDVIKQKGEVEAVKSDLAEHINSALSEKIEIDLTGLEKTTDKSDLIEEENKTVETDFGVQEKEEVEPDFNEMKNEEIESDIEEETQSVAMKCNVSELMEVDKGSSVTAVPVNCVEEDDNCVGVRQDSINETENDFNPQKAVCETENKVSVQAAIVGSEVNENENLDFDEESENKSILDKVTDTPKKSLRLRSGNRGFPSKFSDSFVYGIKVSSGSVSNARKTATQMSVMKTSPTHENATADNDNPTVATMSFNTPSTNIHSSEKQFLSSSLCDTPESCPSVTCSPSSVYSPTTGILKKRLQNTGETPSPPNKQRRVSFADPIFEEKTLPSPISQKRQLTPYSSRSSRRSLLSNYKKRDSVTNGTSGSCNSPGSSQSSYCSTQESQLSCSGPIFTELVSCQEAIGLILPQLTSSMWSRGLSQLLKARKIHTVGDLASLSEYDIHNLPVRSPKVVHVKKILVNFKRNLDAKKDKTSCNLLNTSAGEIMAAAMAAATNNVISEIKNDTSKEKSNLLDAKNVPNNEPKSTELQNPVEQASFSEVEEKTITTPTEQTVEEKESSLQGSPSTEPEEKIAESSSKPEEKIAESSKPEEKTTEQSSEVDKNTSDPSPEAEEKTKDPTTEAEKKSTTPSAETKEKITAPSVQAEERITDPSLEAEEKTTDPSPDAKEKITDPSPEAEEKTIDPSPEAEEKTTDPSPEAEEKTTDPSPEAEEKTTDPSPEAEEKTTDPSTEAEEKTIDPSPEAEEKTTDPSPEAEEKTIDPSTEEEKTTDPSPEAEEKTTDPSPEAEEKTTDPSTEEEKTTEPSTEEEKTTDPSPEAEKSTVPSPEAEENTAAQIVEDKESFLQEMPEFESSQSSLKLDFEEDSVMENEKDITGNEEKEISITTVHQKVPSPESQLTQPPSCDVGQGEPCVKRDISSAFTTTLIPVVNPEAASTPVKSKTCTEDKNIKEVSLSRSEVSCSPIKPVCSETNNLSEDEQDEDEQDEDIFEDDDDRDVSTVEEDVNSILEHSSALLQEVKKLSLSVQELEKTSNSLKFFKDDLTGDKHSQVSQGFDVNHLLPSQPGHSNTSLQESKLLKDISVQKDIEFLPTLKLLLERFSSREIRLLGYSDILQAHSHLQHLLKSTMEAVIPETAKPQND